jgi:predicted DCC family thiol-disulfide oxidoreductase YuxK
MQQNPENFAWTGKDVVLYDGVCGLCNWFVRFVLRHDPAGQFRFAALQGSFGQSVLARHPQEALEDTVILVTAAGTAQEALLLRSNAVLSVARKLGGPWAGLAAPTRCFPPGLRDAAYRLVARHRYRVFGRLDACPLLRPEWQDRFLG